MTLDNKEAWALSDLILEAEKSTSKTLLRIMLSFNFGVTLPVSFLKRAQEILGDKIIKVEKCSDYPGRISKEVRQ
jgi:hypothetical protein